MNEKITNLVEKNKGVLRQLTYLDNEVKRLKRYKYIALLNNCVDDDEAILLKREIKELEEVKQADNSKTNI